MHGSRPTGAWSRGVALLAAALPLVVVAALAVLPPATLDGTPLAWLPPLAAAALLFVATLGALAAMVPGIRTGSGESLLAAGASAALVGVAVNELTGSRVQAPALLLASMLLAGAAIAERAGAAIGRRAAIATVVALLALVETAVLAGLVPGPADALAPYATAGLAAAAVLALAAAVVGRVDMTTAALVAVAAVAFLVDRGHTLESMVGLIALIGSQLVALRGRLEPEEAVDEADQILPELAGRLDDAVLAFDGHLRLREWNAAASGLLGLDAASAGTRLEDLLGVSVAELPSVDGTAVAHRAVGGLEVAMHRSGGKVIAVVRDPGVPPEADQLARELRSTIEELLRARRTIELQRTELERLATVDLLTGVESRSAIIDRLRMEVAQARRYDHPLAVLLLDVDGFRDLNATHGIGAGDAVLREVALRMRLRVREADALGRAGSDGFIAVLPHTDETGAVSFADALRNRLALRPIAIGDELTKVTVSIGLATMRPGEELDVDGLLTRVEEALASARGAGGDRIALDRLHGLVRLEDRRGREPADGPETAQDKGS